jgi:TM2 domain-containing membrane protein YozV/cold shock CspA family protein
MRGRVLSYNDLEGHGLISGDDGQRYTFTRGGLSNGVRVVPSGVDVDFEASEGRASNIYVLRGAYTEQVGGKNKIAAALLAFFLGAFGVHKFYLGMTGPGLIMLLCGTIGWILILPGIAVCIIALVEFVIYLVKTDDQFYQDYVVQKKGWF